MPRCRPGLVAVYHGSPRCGHGSPRFSLGLSRSFGTVFGFNVLCFPSGQGGVIRIGWFRRVPEIK